MHIYFIIASVLLKFIVNTCLRFGNFYTSFLSMSLNITLEHFLNILTICAACGILNTLISPLFDILTPRFMFLVGQIILLLGFLLASFDKELRCVELGWILFFCGSFIIAASVQSIVARALSKINNTDDIGFYTSYLELSWPLSGLVGVPIVGAVLKNSEWPILYYGLIAIDAPIALLYIYYVYFDIDDPEMPAYAPVEVAVTEASINNIPETFSTPKARRSLNLTLDADKFSTPQQKANMHSVGYRSITPSGSVNNSPRLKGMDPHDFERKRMDKMKQSSATISLSAKKYGATDNTNEDFLPPYVAESLPAKVEEISAADLFASSCSKLIAELSSLKCFVYVLATFSLACCSNSAGESFGFWLSDSGMNPEEVGYHAFVFGAGELAGNFVLNRMHAKGYTIKFLMLFGGFIYAFLLWVTAGLQYFEVGIYPILFLYFLGSLFLEILMIGLLSYGTTPNCITDKNIGSIACLFWASMSAGFMFATFIANELYIWRHVPGVLVVMGAFMFTTMTSFRCVIWGDNDE